VFDDTVGFYCQVRIACSYQGQNMLMTWANYVYSRLGKG